MKILVTGGLGFIGSHTVVDLIQQGHTPVIVDNLYNSSLDVLEAITTITGSRPVFYQGDIRDADLLNEIFSDHNDTAAVIHFAALKAVGESVAKPLSYYDNNVVGTLRLLEAMQKHNVKNIIFSSSATVYGDPKTLPIPESHTRSATNTYGQTKLDIEHMLEHLSVSDPDWSVVLLRYFNPIGAHKSGLIGENPQGTPNNLMPFITKVAEGSLPELVVFGDDYDTVDGTGVRDYIHVCDLSQGHVLSLKALEAPGVHAFNLGTGSGTSVLELVKAFETSTGKSVSTAIKDRRLGDIATCFADTTKAAAELGFKTKLSIDEACSDSWNFITKNKE